MAERKKTEEGKEKIEKKEPAPAETPDPPGKKRGLYVVGIGASAGGLESIEQLFRHMPPDTGMAFVIVPHLDPTHVSMMPELIQKYTKMDVTQVKDGMRIKANHIYIIPPQKDMSIHNGSLQLFDFTPGRSFRLPIDHFFRYLAEDRKERAICIILSGMGTDGSKGVKAIKERLGLVMVQDPASSKYSGMPQSAIDTGLADFILQPEKMPEHLIRYIKQISRPEKRMALPGKDKASDMLMKIYGLLRFRTGHDFSSYKKSTIMRRIERRMNLHQIGDISKYVDYMQQNPSEVTGLFKELLIGVTSFFRDPEAFNYLKETVIPKILKDKPKQYALRIWVPGCSSGEEAYSLAIAMHEALSALDQDFKVQIFGTDIDGDALNRARAGRYPNSISADISPERLERYFVKEEDFYAIKKLIREMLVFAVQNVIKDPPFTKLDIICCRNLLIYMDTNLQKKLIPLFHYALNPSGILFLGSSESIGSFVDMFTTLHKKWNIFERREKKYTNQTIIDFPFTPRTDMLPCMPAVKLREEKLSDVVNKIILDNFAPSSVVINDKGEIFYIHGRTGMYLEPSPGEAVMNVFEMAREGIRGYLLAAVRTAATTKKSVTNRDVRVKDNSAQRLINITVRPISESEALRGLYMVIFEDAKDRAAKEPEKKKASKISKEYAGGLERELQYTRESLQTTIEELETSNEELQSANEELQSTNEELQSANEELETSKEELQSVNEELVTVNSELQGKNEELIRMNNDMKNLLDSIKVPTIFLDRNMRIKRFTTDAKKIVNLIDADLGRPLSDIAINFTYENIIGDAQCVLKDLVQREKEVQTNDGNSYMMRISPYRTSEDVIDGIVITFQNINTQRDMAGKIVSLREAIERTENLFNTIQEPLLVLDENLRVIIANSSFYRTFQVAPEEAEGKLLHELGNRQWDIPELRKLLTRIIYEDSAFEDFEVEHDFPKIGRRKMLLNARRIVKMKKGKDLILLAIKDMIIK